MADEDQVHPDFENQGRPPEATDEEWERAVAATERATTLATAFVDAIRQEVFEYGTAILSVTKQIAILAELTDQPFAQVVVDIAAAWEIQARLERGELRLGERP
jgi:PIN domain nuclease of toxin-antitoxin system